MHVRSTSLESKVPSRQPDFNSITDGLTLLDVLAFKRDENGHGLFQVVLQGNEMSWRDESKFSRGCHEIPDGLIHRFLAQREYVKLDRLQAEAELLEQKGTQNQFDADDMNISADETGLRSTDDSFVVTERRSSRIAAMGASMPIEPSPAEHRAATHDEIADHNLKEVLYRDQYFGTIVHPGNSDDPKFVPRICDKGVGDCYAPKDGPNHDRIICTT